MWEFYTSVSFVTCLLADNAMILLDCFSRLIKIHSWQLSIGTLLAKSCHFVLWTRISRVHCSQPCCDFCHILLKSQFGLGIWSSRRRTARSRLRLLSFLWLIACITICLSFGILVRITLNFMTFIPSKCIHRLLGVTILLSWTLTIDGHCIMSLHIYSVCCL